MHVCKNLNSFINLTGLLNIIQQNLGGLPILYNSKIFSDKQVNKNLNNLRKPHRFTITLSAYCAYHT